MRVLWLAHRDITDPRRGGAERTIIEVSTRLASRGHEVHVLVPRSGNAPPEEVVRGVRFHRAATPLGPHVRSLHFYLNPHKGDVVVGDLGHVVPWLTPYTSSIPGVAFFRHLHQRTLSGQTNRVAAAGLRWIERRYPLLFRRWKVVTESASSASDLASLGFQRDQCVEIPPGVDTQAFDLGPKNTLTTILYFGGYRPYKRPLDALRACAKLRDRGFTFRLALVGPGSSSRLVGEELAKLRLHEHTQTTGRLAEADLQRLIRTCHANIHCSVAEGWCYSALEAAACGVPTVAYRVPGVSDCVVDGKTGILVPDADVDALADGLQRVVLAPEGWVARCRERASQFTWDRCVDGWEACLLSRV